MLKYDAADFNTLAAQSKVVIDGTCQDGTTFTCGNGKSCIDVCGSNEEGMNRIKCFQQFSLDVICCYSF